MKQYFLTEITTEDGMIHQGMYFEPKTKKDTALLWIHGLTSAFYHGLKRHEALVSLCEKKGWGYAAFNNRGHDCIANGKIIDPSKEKRKSILIGSGNERFIDCVFDIDAGIDFLKHKGYARIIVIGQSTGANKVCYYAFKRPHSSAAAFILTAPVSDRYTDISKRGLFVRLMKVLTAIGVGDTFINGPYYFPITPKRFLSLFLKNSPEDTFDYGEQKPLLSCFSSITKPLLVMLSERDEYLHMSAKDVKSVYDGHTMSKQYKSVIIPDASHNLEGKEDEMARQIIDWTASI